MSTAKQRKPKSRENGEGSAYQLQDGRWRADVTIGWERRPDGSKRRIRKVVYGATAKEAKAARNDLLRKRDAGELPIGDNVTVGAWLDYWIESIAPRRCVIKTLEGYRGLITRWIKPTIGDVRLRDLEPEHVELLHDAILKGRSWERSNGVEVPGRALSGTTALQAHRILSRALKVAMQRGKLSRNVATLVDPPSIEVAVSRDKYLDLAEAKRVLATAESMWNEAMYAVGLGIGLRPGERLGLIWPAIDLDEGKLLPANQLQRRRERDGVKGQLELVPYVKGKRRRKPITLPAPLVAILRAHRRRQLEMRLALGDEWKGSPLGDLVFANPDGSAIDPRRDWQAWKDLLAKAGVRYVSPHGSRHTAASIMLALGIDVRVVQEILGHSSSQITRDIYQHVIEELAEQTADQMGDALWGDKSDAV